MLKSVLVNWTALASPARTAMVMEAVKDFILACWKSGTNECREEVIGYIRKIVQYTD